MYFVRIGNQTVASGHVGDPIDSPELYRLKTCVGLEIQLDGDELNRVLRWGYPNHGGQFVQIYVGETAAQIIANWS